MEGNAWQGRTIGGFRVGAHIGEGPGGELFEAEQIDRKRPVVLELIAPSVAAAPGFRERFARDAELLRSFFHSNVVTVYAAGADEDGTYFLASRPVEGRTLAALLEEEGPLEHQRARTILAGAAAGLEEAHRHGLVHRGLSPQSIVVGERDGREHVWVTGFAVTDDTSEYGGMFASPAGTAPPPADYVAPELVRGEPATTAADVYALGAILFHALTGRPPFAGLVGDAKLEAHLDDPVPSASELAPGLPTPFDVILARAMAKDPAQRFATPGELAGATPTKDKVLESWRSMLAAGTMAGAGEDEEQPEPGPVAEEPEDVEDVEDVEEGLEEPEAEAAVEEAGPEPAPPAYEEPEAYDIDDDPDVYLDYEDDEVEGEAGEGGEPPVLERVASGDEGRRRNPVGILVAVVLLLAACAGVLAAAGVFDGEDSATVQASAPTSGEEGDAPDDRSGGEDGGTSGERSSSGGGTSGDGEGGGDADAGDGETQSWPAGRSAYTAVVYASPGGREEAEARARRAAGLGLRAGVVQSSDFSNVVPGVWVAYAGVSDSAGEAERIVQRIRAAGIAPQPYVRFLQAR